MFILWIYLLETSLEKHDLGYSVLQFIVAVPFMIYISALSFFEGLVFGYAITLAIALCSIYTIAYNFYGK